LGSLGFRRGERGEKDWSWKKRRSRLRGRRYQCLFWQAEGPSVWAWDRIIDFFINEFGDEPKIKRVVLSINFRNKSGIRLRIHINHSEKEETNV
jgi:hypothetical protein